ncbi:MAG: hypothetical protein EVB10_07570 [Verrucomicrobiaceae bacterium]|nr:MAG: hypothetical protein EVB10_07570 [Verrucomicrobiaceae bacterium]
MADVLLWTFVILGFYVIIIAYWVGAVGLAPGLVERSCERLGQSPWKSFFIGLGMGVPLIGIGLLIANGGAPFIKIFGILIVLLVFLLGLCGSAGLCLRIGKGLEHPLDEAQPWLRVKRGGIVLGLMIIFPVLGWLFVFPVAILTGVGAAFLGWRDSKKVSDE